MTPIYYKRVMFFAHFNAGVRAVDIRAGAAMVIAALCADGVTEIGNIRQIDRGYERIDERLRALGAHIDRVDG